MEFVPDEIITIILSKLDNSVSYRLVCKRWLHVFLNHILPPWKIMHLSDGRTYCGVLSALNVDWHTIDAKRFFELYDDHFDLGEFFFVCFRWTAKRFLWNVKKKTHRGSA